MSEPYSIMGQSETEDHKLTDGAFRLLAEMRSLDYDRDGKIRHSQQTLADRLQWSERTVRRHLTTLSGLGYVRVELSGRSNTIKLTTAVKTVRSDRSELSSGTDSGEQRERYCI